MAEDQEIKQEEQVAETAEASAENPLVTEVVSEEVLPTMNIEDAQVPPVEEVLGTAEEFNPHSVSDFKPKIKGIEAVDLRKDMIELKAPINSTGFSYGSVNFKVINGMCTIPGELLQVALSHGFIQPVR